VLGPTFSCVLNYEENLYLCLIIWRKMKYEFINFLLDVLNMVLTR
jgi:hypothetical protein